MIDDGNGMEWNGMEWEMGSHGLHLGFSVYGCIGVSGRLLLIVLFHCLFYLFFFSPFGINIFCYLHRFVFLWIRIRNLWAHSTRVDILRLVLSIPPKLCFCKENETSGVVCGSFPIWIPRRQGRTAPNTTRCQPRRTRCIASGCLTSMLYCRAC
jgi:hypothetical protein